MEYVKFSKFIISTQYGYTAEETSLVEGDAKYLRITDIVPYFVNKEQVPFCKIDDNKKKKYLISENDLLIARTGATTGYNLVVDESYKNFVFASYLIRFNYNKNELYPLYLKYVLKSQQWYGFVNNFISGSAQPGMNAKVFGKFRIPFFNYDIQKRLSNILRTYDKLIDNNNKRIKLLEQMAENLYKEWFVRFRFPGYEDTEFEDGMPRGWVREKIGLHYNTCSGGTPSRKHEEYYTEGTIPWVKTGEIKDGIIIHTDECITEAGIKGSSAKLLPQGAVVMAMYGVNIGMLAYLDSEMTCNQACCVFNDKNEINSRHYLFHYLYSIRDYLLLIGFGAAQQNLSQDLIKKVKIVIPPAELIKEFDKQKEPLYQTIRALMMQNDKLIKQRDALLPRLMSGKLKV